MSMLCIGYYLANREEIDAYVRQRDEQAEQILRDMEANLTPEARALRTRLRAYQEQQKDRTMIRFLLDENFNGKIARGCVPENQMWI